MWRQLSGRAEYEQGIHAGDVETSVMLALMPEQVKMAQAVRELPVLFSPDSLLSLERPVARVLDDGRFEVRVVRWGMRRWLVLRRDRKF